MNRYQVLKWETREALQKEVEELLRGGWRPQGGVCVFYIDHSGETWYVQAMIV